MIRITVSGDTYDIRKRLKDNHFFWDPTTKTWSRIEGEASLDSTLDKLRPMISWSDVPTPQVFVTLHPVDVNGNLLSDRSFKLKLEALERSGVSVLEEYRKVVSNSHVSPIEAPGPSKPKKEKPRGIDSAFF